MFDARSILDALVRGGGQGPSSSGPSRGDEIFRDLLGQLGGGNVEPRGPMEDRDPPMQSRTPSRDDRIPRGRTREDEDDDHGEYEDRDGGGRYRRDDRTNPTQEPTGPQTGGLSLEDILRDVLGGGRPGAGGAGGGGGGGLQDILRDILGGGGAGPANRMFGEGGQGGGGGAALLETLRQVLGQATSGVREGAGRLDEMTGASGRARDALGQATGQSPEELIAKLRELIGSNKLASGAALGGLGALILGTGAGRSLAGTAVRLGGLALISGLAYKAYQNYQQGLPPLGGARPDPGGPQQLVAAPSGSGFEPDAVTHEQALLYIRSMIAAASADGRIDAGEQQKIAGSVQQAGLGGEAQRFLEGEINNPSTVEDLAASVTSEQDAVQVYAAARIAIDLDSGAEHEFLRRLAEALEIDPSLAAQVDAAARTAS